MGRRWAYSTERVRGIDACSKTRINGPESDCIYSIRDLYAIDLRRALISALIEGERRTKEHTVLTTASRSPPSFSAPTTATTLTVFSWIGASKKAPAIEGLFRHRGNASPPIGPKFRAPIPAENDEDHVFATPQLQQPLEAFPSAGLAAVG